ncbi:MAG: putative Nudix hydrolase NudL [Chloroflexi bacterium]|nr:putative Nudix hydrolase NudL [Chloroflexota bacterium]
MLTANCIKKCLVNHKSENDFPWPNTEETSASHLQAAAVLLPLLQKGGEWHLLFIRRMHNHNDRHSGQVAFPGGRTDTGDEDLLATALREAKEEINLQPADVNVLGCLSHLHTVTKYKVIPFVGQIPWPYALEPEPKEVSSIFTIPLKWLSDPKNRIVRQWTPSPGKIEPYPIIFYEEYRGEMLWGASARMVEELVERLDDC